LKQVKPAANNVYEIIAPCGMLRFIYSTLPTNLKKKDNEKFAAKRKEKK
tara:strand:- start:1186 stop:1332 length:147 start_codon:yes stop_codon:yes gene_type:complete